MGVVVLNPDNPPDYIRIRSASDVQSDSGSVTWRSGGGNTMHKKTWMTSHIGSMQDIVKLNIIVVFLYWIVTKT